MIDREVLVQLSQDLGEEELAGLLVEGIDGTVSALERMHQQKAKGDAQAFVREAHTLKGMTGTLGFRRLARLSEEALTHAREGRTESAYACIPLMELALADTRLALDRMKQARIG
jgi:HPt (histidine-containing phosphotransfer) domain-containing protein